ncbi:uncharacterized protein LOC132738351 [Ruditapes philippinarum]|uniref:uncharacterized protein LOC132738351 n=1 Tax=Ruditapes philippinarum TaxID=129788 RepID=UPI00295BB4E3|nr:uncharacterized protein LOC132738351 [Ruditapes philippinarum]XP_060581818.1 uncharacterized protein LOC132738351 [Ruditapes philippinarum]XP_060581819.1 uncharacterized protein LOC132738351 [Ruditapes philippinarum]XP_060581820.1 uncharacterized protein LOC132738351 [Ruditapes philippinarum]
MRRDVLLTYTHGTNVTENQTSNISSTQVSSELPVIYDQLGNNVDKSREINYKSNKTKLVGGQFYNSYDPEVGINTASVLGGILLVLVLYVIYRTKCRKRLLGLIQRCKMKYFPDDFPNVDSAEQCKNEIVSEESQWISESAKMIWKERANLSRDSESTKHQIDPEQSVNSPGGSCKRESSLHMQTNGHNELECDNSPQKLPDSEENIVKATAFWVQNVKKMDIKERQLNGIVLKIPPDLVSHSAKMRSHFHSVTDYGDVNDLVNISQLNKSLPSLVEQKTCVKMNYANIPNVKSKNVYVPLATQEDDIDLQPSTLEVKHTSGSKVPLDICPIVKVQHYQSRSKRRLTSLCHSSSEDDMSSSSDDQKPAIKSLSKTVSDAKYMRLETKESISPVNINSSSFTTTGSVHGSTVVDKHVSLTNNHSKRPGIRSLETNL